MYYRETVEGQHPIVWPGSERRIHCCTTELEMNQILSHTNYRMCQNQSIVVTFHAYWVINFRNDVHFSEIITSISTFIAVPSFVRRFTSVTLLLTALE
jgi:hypothetical protein